MCSSKIIASTILLLNATDMNVMYVFDDSILFFRVFVYLIYGIKTYLTYFRLRSETLTGMLPIHISRSETYSCVLGVH